MKRIVWTFVVCACVGYAATVLAQEKPTPTKVEPALTEVQRLQVQNVLLRIELAQRTIQQAQADFEKARTDATALMQGLQVPGYTLDLQTLTYTAAKPPALPEKK
jgi:hypothetical protein